MRNALQYSISLYDPQYPAHLPIATAHSAAVDLTALNRAAGVELDSMEHTDASRSNDTYVLRNATPLPVEEHQPPRPHLAGLDIRSGNPGPSLLGLLHH